MQIRGFASDQKTTGIVSPDLVPYAVPLLAFGAACRDVRLFHVATHRHCATVRFEQLCQLTWASLGETSFGA